jgi:hypothetical protein
VVALLTLSLTLVGVRIWVLGVGSARTVRCWLVTAARPGRRIRQPAERDEEYERSSDGGCAPPLPSLEPTTHVLIVRRPVAKG